MAEDKEKVIQDAIKEAQKAAEKEENSMRGGLALRSWPLLFFVLKGMLKMEKRGDQRYGG